jgi:hypothetical protein
VEDRRELAELLPVCFCVWGAALVGALALSRALLDVSWSGLHMHSDPPCSSDPGYTLGLALGLVLDPSPSWSSTLPQSSPPAFALVSAPVSPPAESNGLSSPYFIENGSDQNLTDASAAIWTFLA